MKILKHRKLPAEKVLCAVLCFAFCAGMPLLPASAAETGSLFRCDTTGIITRSVGENYRFLVTAKFADTKVTFTAGNGKVLRTFIAGKPVTDLSGTKKYYFGFQCTGQGTTSVYIKVNGQTERLFSVKVPGFTTVKTNRFSVSVPQNWDTKILPSTTFQEAGKEIGGISLLDYDSTQPISQFYGNHTEEMSSEKFSNSPIPITKAIIRRTQPAASGDQSFVGELHYYFVPNNSKLAYDLNFNVNLVSRDTADRIAKSFRLLQTEN